MKPKRKRVSVAVIGGGITGITAALYLAKTGRFRVTLFEKEKELGGLSRSYRWKDIVWDRFYHVILSTDTHLLKLIESLNLQNEISWCDSKSGFYDKGRLVSFSSALDFLLFPFLSIWQKFRLAAGIIFCSRIKDPDKLGRVYVRQWLTGVFGRRVYEKFWDPLLRSKLGTARGRTSGAFMWATIKRMYGARSSGTKQEKMGYVHGGYHRILQFAESELEKRGVKILTQNTVTKVSARLDSYTLKKNGAIDTHLSTHSEEMVSIETFSNTLKFDKVLLTIPSPSILRMLGDPDDHPYWQMLHGVDYLSMVCVFLVLTRKLSPYYVINLLDKSLPFTGIIEATNVVLPTEVGNRHLIYLPKYLPAEDPMNHVEDDQIIEYFVANLKKVYPDLSNEDILHRQIFREKYVQPLQELNFLDRAMGFKTPLDNIYIVNSSMIYNSNLNNNAVIDLAQRAVSIISKE